MVQRWQVGSGGTVAEGLEILTFTLFPLDNFIGFTGWVGGGVMGSIQGFPGFGSVF